jgi:hypothetical protein
VLWRIFGWYVVGAVLAFAAMRYVAYVPDKAVVYLLLGLLPFAVEVLPSRCAPISSGVGLRSSPASSPR